MGNGAELNQFARVCSYFINGRAMDYLNCRHAHKRVMKYFIISGTIKCSDLNHPEYGSVNVTDYTPESSAHYKCDYGYKLVGDEYRECLYSGYWGGKQPVCKSMLIERN